LFTARGQLDKGHRHLEFAATRLHEARSLSPTSSHLPSTLDAMDSQTRVGATDLITVARSTHSTAPLTQLRTFTHSQYAGLQALIATSPPALRQREISSANLLAALDQQAAQLSAAVPGAVIGPESGPGTGGLGGLLQGGLPAPGSVVGSPPAQPSPGTGLLPPRPKGSHPAVPVPTTSGLPLPLPVPSLPIKIPTTLPTILPPLPTTLPSILPTTVPTVLPPLPSTLPTLLPSVLPTIKL
jgi:hypothetical protein